MYDRLKNEPGYAPENPLIGLAALQAHLNDVKAVNDEIAPLAQVYGQAQDDRVPMYHGAEGLTKRVGMLRDIVGGFENGKKLAAYATLQRLAQEMRGYQKPKNDPIPDGTAGPGADAQSAAQTSFGSLLQKAKEALGTVKGMGAAFKTSNPLVTMAELTKYLTTVEAQDTVVSDALNPLKEKTKQRVKLYEGETGLRKRMAAAKSHVAGEHTKGSQLYKDLVKIKY